MKVTCSSSKVVSSVKVGCRNAQNALALPGALWGYGLKKHGRVLDPVRVEGKGSNSVSPLERCSCELRAQSDCCGPSGCRRS